MIDHYYSSPLPKKELSRIEETAPRTRSNKKKHPSNTSPMRGRQAVDLLSPAATRSPAERAKSLYSAQKKCQKSAQYKRASSVKNKLAQSKSLVLNIKLVELQKEHEYQRQVIRSAHLQQLEFIRSKWHSRKSEESKRYRQIVRHWQEGRVRDRVRLHKEIQKLERTRRMVNKDIIVMQNVEEMLVEKEMYEQAAEVRRQARLARLQLEQKTRQQVKQRKNSLNKVVKQLHQRQCQVLTDRVEHGLQELEESQKHEMEKAVKKFNNIMMQLESQQTQQRQALIRSAKNVKMLGRIDAEWILNHSNQTIH